MRWLRNALAVLAVLVVVAAAVLPAWRYRAPMDPLDVATGLVLLVCGLLVRGGRRRDVVGIMLILGALTWALPDLVPTGDDRVDQVVRTTYLAHDFAVGLAVLVAARWPIDAVRDQAAAVLLALAAVSGSVGGYEFAVPAAGAALVVSTWGSRPTTRAAGTILGASLILAQLADLNSSSVQLGLPSVLHEFALMLSAMLLAVDAQSRRDDTAIDVRADDLTSLETTLADALGVPRVSLAFPDGAGGWLDASGNSRITPGEGREVVERGDVVAVVDGVHGPVPASVVDVLRLVRDHARLRRSVAISLDDLEESRRRLLVAGDVERRELGDQLVTGALARVDEVRQALSTDDEFTALAQRARATRSELLELARGLDPLTRGLSLVDAVRALATTSVVGVEVRGAVEPVGDAERRTAWFVCSEAVTNTAKHAPGARVVIELGGRTGEFVLSVSDDGPGGADAEGGGLVGLRDRAAALGGSLEVASAPGSGTRLVLRLPSPPAELPAQSGVLERSGV
jgi:signal transduction histidine kinase